MFTSVAPFCYDKNRCTEGTACSLSLKVFVLTMFADLISVSQGHSQRK